MHKKGIFGLVCSLSWVVTALVALNIGLSALQVYDFFSMGFFATNPAFRMYLEVAIGALGAWSLFGYVKHMFFCSSNCEC